MKNTIAGSLAVVFSFVLTACGVSSTSQQIGSAGGAVKLGSALTLSVPAGAVDDGTVITIRELEQRGQEREFEFEPRGLELREPAEVEVESSRAGRLLETENEVEHGIEAEHFDGHHMRGKLRKLGHLTLRGSDDSDGGADDHGGRGRGTDDADGGADDHGNHDGGSATGAACVDDDTCACGSECVVGRCTAVVTCSSSADCQAGESCRAAQRHGQACGVMACHP